MTNKQNQNHVGENYLNIMSCYYICLCIDKLGKVLQIFCYEKTDTCFIMKKKIMVKKGKEDKWLLPKLSLMYMTMEILFQLVIKFVKHILRGKL